MSGNDPAEALPPSGPSSPNITLKDIARQFHLDVTGKEVQSATTYSYTWLADQAGHIGLGLLIYLLLALVALMARKIVPALEFAILWEEIAALVIGIGVVSYWEFRAYKAAVAGATGLFPVDRELLLANAVAAATYMAIGVVGGFVFQQSALVRIIGFLALAMLAVALALPWLRQKIIWQRAALPYLFRLADAPRTVNTAQARELQAFLDKGAPPDALPVQVIVGGPVGSGRTNIAAGIGTEFAFKKATVRYLSLDTLLEFVSQPPLPPFPDDTGPVNINYWRWSDAQVVIIDDIGPVITAPERQTSPELFAELLRKCLGPASQVLAKCHSVWVLGDLHPDVNTTMAGQKLDNFARVITTFCQGQNEAIVVELAEPPDSSDLSGMRPMLNSNARPLQVRKVK
jgi:hypothetical protein